MSKRVSIGEECMASIFDEAEWGSIERTSVVLIDD